MTQAFRVHVVEAGGTLPAWAGIDELARFLHEHLKPYEDPEEDIRQGIQGALTPGGTNAGFVLLAEEGEVLLGALVMLRTGMQGYVPPYLLLFVAVHRGQRGRGVGSALIQTGVQRCGGPVKLHVEYENPARRLYERLGFTSKYAEMRWSGAPEEVNG